MKPSEKEGESEYHYMPEGDLKDHELSEFCWCKPTMTPYDPEEQVRLWVHNYLH